MNRKKTKISALLIFTAMILQFGSNAQQSFQKTKAGIQSPVAIEDQTSEVLKTSEVLILNQAVIWSEDFAGGIPAGWTNTGSPAAALWEYRGPFTTPDNTVGGQGACSSGNPMTSPTAGNGFMIFDSNYLDDTGPSCPPAGPVGPAPAPHSGILQTDSINLSAYPFVALSFYQYIRDFQATQTINISVDGGSIWTPVWEGGLAVNENTAFDDFVIIDISAIAGNQADVRLQFVFDGQYYEWQIDDITIAELPPYDAGMMSISIEPYYYLTPAIQIDSFTFSGSVKNAGLNTINNLTLDVDVDAGLFTDSISVSSVPSFDTIFLTVPNSFMPVSNGTFNAEFTVNIDSTDGEPTNDTLSRIFYFNPNDSVYARDNGNATSGVFAGPNNPFQTGPLYSLLVADDITSVSAYISPTSDTGTPVFAYVNQFDDIAGLPTARVARSTNPYTLTTFDIGSFLTVALDSPAAPITLAPGLYVVSFGYEDTAFTFAVGTNTDTYLPGVNYFKTLTGNWNPLSLETTVMVRANFGSLAALAVAITNSANVTCAGACDGWAAVTVTGGALPYTYSWSNGCTSLTCTGLCAGTYTVVVTDNAGSVDSATVIITEPASFNISVTPSPGIYCASGDTVTLTASGAAAYAWSPNYEINDTTLAAVDIYPTADTVYTVIGTDAFGCADTVTVSVQISSGAAFAVFDADTTSGCDSITVTFTNFSINAIGYAWSFPGGTPNTSNLQNPIVTFDSAGTFNVTLTAYGCTDTSTSFPPIPITVNPLPTVTFAALPNVCDTIAAFALTEGSPAGGTYFGTGVSANNFDPGIGVGTYTLTYTYTDTITSCKDSVTQTITVVDTCVAVGISEFFGAANNIRLYPNPTTGILNIEIKNFCRDEACLVSTNPGWIEKGAKGVNIFIYNLLGEVVAEIANTNEFTSIDLSELLKGTYFIKIQTTNQVITRKVNVVR